MACEAAKEYLSQRGVQFVDKNIAADAEAREEMIQRADGAMATPTILVGDQVVIGFDPKKLDEALKT